MSATIDRGVQRCLEELRDWLEDNLDSYRANVAAASGTAVPSPNSYLVTRTPMSQNDRTYNVTLPAVVVLCNGQALRQPMCTPQVEYVIPILIAVLVHPADGPNDEAADAVAHRMAQTVAESLEELWRLGALWDDTDGIGLRAFRDMRESNDVIAVDRPADLRQAAVTLTAIWREPRHWTL